MTSRALILAVFATAIGVSNARAQSFPDGWAGTWRGTLEISSGPDVRQRIPVQLEIGATADPAAYVWRTLFNHRRARGLRDYRLRVLDAATGRYAIDEGNGIVIGARLTGGALVSAYTVDDAAFLATVEVRGDFLYFDLYFWNSADAKETRGSGANAEGGALVKAYDARGRQHAVMTRQR